MKSINITHPLQEVLEQCRTALSAVAANDDYISRTCGYDAPTPQGWLTHGMVSECSDALTRLDEVLSEDVAQD